MPEEVKTQDVKKEAPVERPTNCVKCNKRMKRKSWYYRNGGFYCSKGCWKQAEAKSKQKDSKEKQK